MTSAEYQQLVESLDRQFTEIGHRFTGMDRRFDGVGLRVSELRQEMLGHFDAIYYRFERLEHVAVLQSPIEEIEQRLGR